MRQGKCSGKEKLQKILQQQNFSFEVFFSEYTDSFVLQLNWAYLFKENNPLKISQKKLHLSLKIDWYWSTIMQRDMWTRYTIFLLLFLEQDTETFSLLPCHLASSSLSLFSFSLSLPLYRLAIKSPILAAGHFSLSQQSTPPPPLQLIISSEKANDPMKERECDGCDQEACMEKEHIAWTYKMWGKEQILNTAGCREASRWEKRVKN